MSFRLEGEKRKKLDELVKAKHISRAEALRDAVNEYLALYLVNYEPTVGRLDRRMREMDQRLTKVEELLMKRGAEKK